MAERVTLTLRVEPTTGPPGDVTIVVREFAPGASRTLFVGVWGERHPWDAGDWNQLGWLVASACEQALSRCAPQVPVIPF